MKPSGTSSSNSVGDPLAPAFFQYMCQPSSGVTSTITLNVWFGPTQPTSVRTSITAWPGCSAGASSAGK